MVIIPHPHQTIKLQTIFALQSADLATQWLKYQVCDHQALYMITAPPAVIMQGW